MLGGHCLSFLRISVRVSVVPAASAMLWSVPDFLLASLHVSIVRDREDVEKSRSTDAAGPRALTREAEEVGRPRKISASLGQWDRAGRSEEPSTSKACEVVGMHACMHPLRRQQNATPRS